VGLDVVGDQGAMHQGHLGIDCLDFGVSAPDVGANESENHLPVGSMLVKYPSQVNARFGMS